MKNLLTFPVLLIWLALGAGAAHATNVTLLDLTPGGQAVTQGQTFDVSVTLDDIWTYDPLNPDSADPAIAFQFNVDYPSFLTFDSITEEGLFGMDGSGFFYDDSTTGVVAGISDALTGSLTETPGDIDTLVTLQFTATGTGDDFITIDPSSILLLDANYNSINPDPSSVFSSEVISTLSSPGSSTPEPSTFIPLGVLAVCCVSVRCRRPNRT